MSDFVHLHVHSEYSLLDGLGKLEKMISRVLEDGQKALALTDHGVMHGAVKFYLQAKEHGLKPIIGMEAYVARKNRFDREKTRERAYSHLLLLAKNERGYKNLIKLSTIGHLEGFYYKPRIDDEVLERFHEGLIATTACLRGEIPQLLLSHEEKVAEEKVKRMAEIFGEDNFYLEVQNHPRIGEQQVANEKLFKLSRRLGLPLLATNDVHYVDPQDAEAQEILLCIQTKETINNPKRRLSMIDSRDFYLKTSGEMKEAFLDYKEAIENTLKVAEACDLKMEMDRFIFPEFPDTPEGKTPDGYLRELVLERIGDYYPKPDKALKRAERELSIIKKMGYSTYFLVVADFMKWAQKNEIETNTRGSGAGSLVAYVLGISKLDPLFYNLPFERFMHEARPSPPDIDVDFADVRRDEVIAYVKEKYGEAKVAQIVTFGTMEVRQAIRDAGRALGMPYSVPDRLARMVPPPKQGFHMSMEEALSHSAELSHAYKTEEESRRLIDIAKKLVGVARHASVHAAGMVISDKPLIEYVPLQRDPKGEKVITQYDMYSLDLNASEHAIGLLKMDFLGLRHLTILQETIRLISEIEGKEIKADNIPLDDQKTFEMVGAGETVGVFQLGESRGMMRLARELKPNSIFDFAAMVALFRPGPIELIPEFITRKRNPAQIGYLHPDLKPILGETYGVIVYQEQVMEIAHKMAGFSLAQADGFRRAMGKKKRSLMKKEGQKFIEGCVKKGYAKSLAEKVYAMIEKFASYGFNKAHAASYGLLAYKTAYLKANYPGEYLCVMLAAEAAAGGGPHRDAKLARVANEARRMGIEILPVDINCSQKSFSIEKEGGKKKIRVGLSAVKNVGKAAISSILESRLEGEFDSLLDFCQRVNLQKVNRKTLESLIKAGAFDCFGTRAAHLLVLSRFIEEASRLRKKRASGQMGLFETGVDQEELKILLPAVEELPSEQLFSFEKELFGFYLREHPLEKIFEKLEGVVSHQIGELEVKEHTGQRIKLGGLVVSVKQIVTRQGNRNMAFVRLEDKTGQIELVVFPNVYEESIQIWQQDRAVLVEGRVDNKEEKLVIIVEKASPILSETSTQPQQEEVRKSLRKNQGNNKEVDGALEIDLPPDISPETLKKLNQTLSGRPGKQKVRLVFNFGSEIKKITLPYGVVFDRELKEKVENLLFS